MNISLIIFIIRVLALWYSWSRVNSVSIGLINYAKSNFFINSRIFADLSLVFQSLLNTNQLFKYVKI